MSGVDELYPPTQYPALWLFLALGVIVLCVLGGYLLVFFTRPRYKLPAAEEPQKIPTNFEITQALRREYLQRLDQVLADYTAGRIDPRTANLQLSRQVRNFVQDYSGLAAPVMTLHDLRMLQVPPQLLDAIARHYYPSIFAPTIVIDPVAGLAAGKLVVNQWY